MKTIACLTLFLALTFVQCDIGCWNEKDRYYYVPDDRKLKYDEGDVFIYESNFGNLDTIIILSVKKDLTPGEEHCKKYHYSEDIIIKYEHSKQMESEIGELTIFQSGGRGSNSLDWLNGYKYGFFSDLKPEYDFYTINNIEYRDVYYREEPAIISKDYYCDEGYKTEIMFYSCETGILKYGFENGEIFVLQEIIEN